MPSLRPIDFAELRRSFPSAVPPEKTAGNGTYDVVVALPRGERTFLWFTILDGKKVCLLVQPNGKGYFYENTAEFVAPSMTAAAVRHFNPDLATRGAGTLLYGTLVHENGQKMFIADDLPFYWGQNLLGFPFSERFFLMRKFFTENQVSFPKFFPIALAVAAIIPTAIEFDYGRVRYPIMRFQWRSSSLVTEYVNEPTTPLVLENKDKKPFYGPEQKIAQLTATAREKIKFNDAKPQFQKKTAFVTRETDKTDNYEIFAAGKGGALISCGIAGIDSFENSVLIKKLFGADPKPLDQLEESSSEEEEESGEAKTRIFQFVYNREFKRWIVDSPCPPNTKPVHISAIATFW